MDSIIMQMEQILQQVYNNSNKLKIDVPWYIRKPAFMHLIPYTYCQLLFCPILHKHFINELFIHKKSDICSLAV